VISTVGVYGKIPEKGDFILRNVSRDFVGGWDDWLGSSIIFGKETLGDQWLEAYLTSPVWRFVLSAGVFGPAGWAGVFIPSIDRVRRQFPLAIVAQLAWPAQRSVAEVYDDCAVFFEEAESAALIGLAERLDLDRYFGVVDRVLAPELRKSSSLGGAEGGLEQPSPSESPGEVAILGRGDIKGFALPSEPSSVPLVRALSPIALRTQSRFPLCVWSTSGSASVPPQLCVSGGVPDPARFVGFVRDGFLQGTPA
jgi:type VI secretion system protein ImpM